MQPEISAEISKPQRRSPTRQTAGEATGVAWVFDGCYLGIPMGVAWVLAWVFMGVRLGFSGTEYGYMYGYRAKLRVGVGWL